MIICIAPHAIDGDTLACGNLPANIRLLGIDAPELPGHCRRGRVCTPGDGAASSRVLARLVARGTVTCQPRGHDRYARILARCTAASIDLSCALLAVGVAVPRYGRISCPIRGTRGEQTVTPGVPSRTVPQHAIRAVRVDLNPLKP